MSHKVALVTEGTSGIGKAEETANAVIWLSSDHTLIIDGGLTVQYPIALVHLLSSLFLS